MNKPEVRAKPDPASVRQRRKLLMTSRKSAYEMIPVPEAIKIVLENTHSLAPITVLLSEAIGRRLAEDIYSSVNLPPFRASIVDGYAVHAGDGEGEFQVVSRVTAGAAESQLKLSPGKAAYITTGAPVPDGADAVVMIENTEGITNVETGEETGVRILRKISSGANIRPIGCDIKAGEQLLSKNTVLEAPEIGLLASVGCSQVRVYAKPVVGVLSTGNELTEHGSPDAASYGKIRDSNRPMLVAALKEMGVQVVDLGIAADDADVLFPYLMDAFKRVDVLITSGGVSMGELDLVKPFYEKMGQVHFGRLHMKPGKPTTFATVKIGDEENPRLGFALPGNPVSCHVCLHLLVAPALKKLAGAVDNDCFYPQIDVKLMSTLRLDVERPEYHRAIVEWSSSERCFLARSTGSQASSRLLSIKSCRSANALLCLPCAHGSLDVGAFVPALLIGALQGSPYTDIPSAECTKSRISVATTSGYASFTDESKLSLTVGLLTVSDRASQGVYADASGQLLRRLLTELEASKESYQLLSKANITISDQRIVPDERESIQSTLLEWCDMQGLDVVLSTGGTGFAPRDITPEAVKPLLDKEAPGIVQLLIAHSLQYTPFAVLSRPVAGVRKQTLVITMPGSAKAIKEQMEVLLPLLAHISSLIKGKETVHKHPRTTQEKKTEVQSSQSQIEMDVPACPHGRHHH